MCGITGILGKDVDKEKLIKATELLAHRGPDDSGIYIADGIGLGHQRLSIIDLSSAAHQPMPNEDDTIQIVYNGEIYNFKELRAELELKGHSFLSNSDTEVILHLYEEYGPECVKKLNGMFAFAIWNSKLKNLFVARDRSGIKPLYLYRNKEVFMFSSEIKSLFELGAPKILNKPFLYDYFNYQISIAYETLFKGIYAFPPGHYANVTENSFKIDEYWHPQYSCCDDITSEDLKNELEESIRKQMVSDVPVGTFLSGGLDSSIITALAAKHSKNPIKTFTAGFEGYEKEIKNAAAASKSLGTEHYSITITPRMFMDALPKLIYQYDQPISFASSVALYFVSQLAAKNGVKVILTGEGADELFAGYSRYRRIDNIMTVTNGDGFRFFGGLPFKIASKFFYDPRYLKMLELYLDGNNYDYLTGVNSIIGKERKDAIFELGYDKDYGDMHHPLRNRVKKLMERNKEDSFLNKLLYLDWNTYLRELLTKQDRMSMAASIESRVPFLDNNIIELANSLPIDSKLNEKTGKYILREAAKDILPKEILKRKKIGFTVPLDKWFKGPLKDYINEELSHPIIYKFFNEEYVITTLQRQKKHNCSLQIWAMLNFKLWYQQHFQPDEIKVPEKVIPIRIVSDDTKDKENKGKKK